MDEMLAASSELSISPHLQTEAPPIDWIDCDIWKLANLFGTNCIAPVWSDDKFAPDVKESPNSVLLCEILKASLQHPDAIRAWKALQLMVEQPYWSRVWIQQETICGEKVVPHYGKQYGSFLSFWRLSVLFSRTQHNIPVAQTLVWADLMFHSFLRLRLISSRAFALHFQKEGCKTKGMIMSADSAWMLVIEQYHNHATDPLDKIYGLLGMVEPWSQGSFGFDYTASPPEVYCKAAKSLVEHFKSLAMFSEMEKIPQQCRDASLPSWCPDLNHYIDRRQPKQGGLGSIHIYDIPYRLCVWKTGKVFKAAAETEAICKFSADGKILSAEGFRLANIKALHCGFQIFDGDFFNGNKIEEIKPIAFDAKGLYTTESETRNAMWRTLCTDRPWTAADKGDFAPSYYEHAFDLWCKQVLPIREDVDTSSFYISTQHIPREFGPPGGLDQNGLSEWLINFMGPFYKAFTHATHHRRFCVSAAGFGLAPSDAEVGDVLCVLLGCRVPVVLRPVDDHYLFVGEAYMYGWMHGQAIDKANEGELQPEVFDIH